MRSAGGVDKEWEGLSICLPQMQIRQRLDRPVAVVRSVAAAIARWKLFHIRRSERAGAQGRRL